MKTITFLILILAVSCLYSQVNSTGSFVGKETVSGNINGNIQYRIVTTPQIYNRDLNSKSLNSPSVDLIDNNSSIRWKFTDPVAIGYSNMVSGNGLYFSEGWGLNTQRISLYGQTNNIPLWEYYTGAAFTNYVAISDTGGTIAASSLSNVYMFNRSSSTPFFNFNIASLGNFSAGPIDITNNGGFIVVGINSGTPTTDSSIVAGFSRTSTNPDWTFKVWQTTAGGSSIQGVKIAGDDTLAIVNTYGGFYVIKTYTGQIIYQGPINPSSSSGTQTSQGISGNGNVIATINYSGYVRVFQRSGNTYNFLWQHQEPPGTYYNWMSAVDVSYDGSMEAVGTLNFLTSSTYDGKVKLFRTTNGSTPIWTYAGAGDEIAQVAFSKNGHIVIGCSWGDYYNPMKENFFVFKTSHNDNLPIYSFTDSAGSFFSCSISNDGTTASGSGKKVHARQFGNGGVLYNIYVDTAEPVGVLNNHNIAGKFELLQNYPNPFNPSTQINYSIAKDGFVKLTVFDIMGRKITVPVDKFQKAGKYGVEFNAENLSSGMYFYRIEANGFTDTKKMILLK
jgi:hypothetical protein